MNILLKFIYILPLYYGFIFIFSDLFSYEFNGHYRKRSIINAGLRSMSMHLEYGLMNIYKYLFALLFLFIEIAGDN